ncbi:MAG: hypothetical protein R3A80_04425 [Bdellovibrionota bacterium]
MSLSRFDSTGELLEFVSFSTEVARGQDETAHLFEFIPTTTPQKETENPQHVFLVIGPQSKEARVDSYIASMALKSLQRGYMVPQDKLYFSTLVGFDTNAEATGPKIEKLLKTVDRWITQAQPRCVILLRRGEAGLRCHKLTDPIHDKLAEISEKQITASELTLESVPGNTLQDEILKLCIKKDLSILEIGLDPIQKSFEECAQSEWKLSSGPVIRWMFESLPFKMTLAPEMPVLEVIPPLEIPAEFNL